MPDLGEGAHVDAQREGAVASAPPSDDATSARQQSTAKVTPVVVKAVATKKKRNQADLSNGVTAATLQQADSSCGRRRALTWLVSMACRLNPLPANPR